jgi:putative hydrolase of the HAD superfamily
MFDLIAFDADDTLWENNALYLQARDRFKDILAKYPLSASVEERLEETEVANLKYFGFGAMSFILSMIETGVDITAGQVSAADIKAIVAIAKDMIAAEVRLYEDSEPTLAQLSRQQRLILITKGDLLHQQSKVERSGLRSYFQAVEVVADKTPAVYTALLDKYGVSPAHFLMVGDSMRSDMLPVLGLGGFAVFVPNADTWTHEKMEPPQGFEGRFFELERLSQLPDLLAQLALSKK